ncbi:30S ribosomal protein S9 [Candidatus Parcubacteria bacterium]|jgi:small subunit ribosomal protein S9|nr:30S ribosomal protein S9 [Candidatus Parcubacteria bacterium]
MSVKTDNKEYTPAVGKRKCAIARIRLLNKKVNGIEIIVNEKDYKVYFPYFEWQEAILKPIILAGQENIAFSIKVHGGGPKGQSDAVRHGIAKVLLKQDEELRATLKKEGLLTRDSRVKERKKPGLRKARRAPQWSKR